MVIILFAIVSVQDESGFISLIRNLSAIGMVTLGLGYFLVIFPLFMPTVVVSRIFDTIEMKRAVIATIATYLIYGVTMGLLYGLMTAIF